MLTISSERRHRPPVIRQIRLIRRGPLVDPPNMSVCALGRASTGVRRDDIPIAHGGACVTRLSTAFCWPRCLAAGGSISAVPPQTQTQNPFGQAAGWIQSARGRAPNYFPAAPASRHGAGCTIAGRIRRPAGRFAAAWRTDDSHRVVQHPGVRRREGREAVRHADAGAGRSATFTSWRSRKFARRDDYFLDNFLRDYVNAERPAAITTT